jgi:hypothetical protein
MDNVKEGAQAVDLIQFPRQRTGQVKAEAVHMHIHNPVAQAVHNELEHAGCRTLSEFPVPV